MHQSIDQYSGAGGAEHARKWLKQDMTKNAIELADYRQKLNSKDRILIKTKIPARECDRHCI